MTCPCKALDNALLEGARKAKRIAVLEARVDDLEDRADDAEREREDARAALASMVLACPENCTRERHCGRCRIAFNVLPQPVWVD